MAFRWPESGKSRRARPNQFADRRQTRAFAERVDALVPRCMRGSLLFRQKASRGESSNGHDGLRLVAAASCNIRRTPKQQTLTNRNLAARQGRVSRGYGKS